MKKIALLSVSILLLLGASFFIAAAGITRAQSAPAYLHWSPPQLDNPTTITLGTGATSTNLNPNRDYIIQFPDAKKTGYTWISGGRNIVIKGGYLTTPTGYTNTSERRALYIKEATGTVHVEGLLIDSTGGGEHDAIAINAPEAVVQVQNIRVENLTGSYNSEHADLIQPWGGVRELRVDRLTGSTNYQGFYLVQTQSGSIGPVTIRNVNLIHQANPAQNVPAMIYMDDDCDWHPAHVSFTNVFIQPHASRPFQYVVEPATDNPTCGSTLSNATLSWPKTSWISGEVRMGLPAQGDFVRRQSVGLGYVSPGYLADQPQPPKSPSPSPGGGDAGSPPADPKPRQPVPGSASLGMDGWQPGDEPAADDQEAADDEKIAPGELRLSVRSGSIFSMDRPELTGRAAPASRVEVSITSVESGVVEADADGRWVYIPKSPLADGEYAYTARLIHDDGSFGEAVGPRRFRIALGGAESQDSAARSWRPLGFAAAAVVVIGGSAGGLFYLRRRAA